MDGFRAILAVLGLVVVGLVYWYTQRENRRQQQQRIEPTFGDAPDENDTPPGDSLDDEHDIPVLTNAVVEDVAASDHDDTPAVAGDPPESEKIVAVRVVARDDDALDGEKLVLALRGLGLRHGQYGIFHRFEAEEQPPVFSVANLTEPGSFELANIREQTFTGVSLFLVLPGTLPGPEAFDMMIETARAIAKSFDADLLDASGSTLSIQRERFIREEVIQFEHDRTVRVAR